MGSFWACDEWMKWNTRTALYEIEKTEGKPEHPREDAVDNLGPFHLLPGRLQVDGANDRIDGEGDAPVQREFCGQLG